ncbi:MAG: PorT family protein [Gemmatimonadales bacterium]|nr:PorT family protein [Gemmatimonadales bacterium]
MKRTNHCVTLLALMAIPTIASAQGKPAGFGLKVGAVFANVSNSGVLPNDMGSRTGFSAGLALGIPGGVVGFGAEALYVQHGLKSSASANSLKIDYVSIPVYLRLGIPTPGVQPYAYAGPQVSFELRCKIGSSDCPDNTFGGGERKKTTYAGVIGAGLRLGGKAGLTIEGRYVYGLTDLKYGTVTSSDSYKNRDLMILAGVSF